MRTLCFFNHFRNSGGMIALVLLVAGCGGGNGSSLALEQALSPSTDSSTVSVSGTLVGSIGYFKASNTGGGDEFGRAVALSDDGTTLAVGAPDEDSNATGVDGADNNLASRSGAAYVFTRSGISWTQQAYIKASNTGGSDEFGYVVALSGDGNTLAVGARYEESDATGIDGDQANDLASESGAVYVFTRSGSDWTQQAYIKASNTEEDDHFGRVVALSDDGNTLAAGARNEDGDATDTGEAFPDFNDASNAGAVYVFARSGSTWVQQAYLKAGNAFDDDHFGSAVALGDDGNTLAVGARQEDGGATGINGANNNASSSSGAAYVFTRSGSSWTQQAYIKASNTGSGDEFGQAIALSDDGNTLAVGADQEDSAATGIDGDQTSSSASSSGAVYVFTYDGSDWSQQAYIKASNTGSSDRFGHAVGLSGDGNTLAVRAHREDSNATGIGGDQSDNSAGGSGAVYLFTRSGGSWSQQAYIKASNTGNSDRFGQDVALNEDGDTLAVGADDEDSNATGIGGDQTDDSLFSSGAVYLY